jgi:putative Mn2+ efflux pump MntP
MSYWEILLLALAVSMDACAVAMTDGMTEKKITPTKALTIGGFFGFFQFLMPLIGFFVTGVIASAFLSVFEKLSAWIAFGLLLFLGSKMLWEGISDWKNGGACAVPVDRKSLTIKKLFVQAIATSIDALAVGVTLKMTEISSYLSTGVWGATTTIGVITMALSFVATYIGKAMGCKLADKANLVGGAVLIGIGLKIFIGSFL